MKPTRDSQDQPDVDAGGRRSCRTLAWAMAGGLLLWAAFPPLGCWPLAWLAPVCWLLLIREPCLPGRRPYLALWFAGLIHWLLLVEGIRRAHPALYLGWAALAAYLAVYLVLFVGLTRVAVHRWRIPLVAAAPVVWTGLELLRGYALSGFSMGLLGHTLSDHPRLIQIADLCGAYGVSFLVILVAAGLAQWLPETLVRGSFRGNWNRWALVPAAVALAGMLLYGQARLNQPLQSAEASPPLRVALIQESCDTVFPMEPERAEEDFYRYRKLSREAALAQPVDVIVWPESAFSGALGDLRIEGPLQVPEGIEIAPDEFRTNVLSWDEAFRAKCNDVARLMNSAPAAGTDGDRHEVALIVGSDTQVLDGRDAHRYNSALLLNPRGVVLQRYYKMHRVMFGEYVPLGEQFPILHQMTPIREGIAAGESIPAFQVKGITIAPSICFESTVPHLIRRQLDALQDQGDTPRILVNLTNDGWFRGTGMLDLHLSCAVFRAVENRLPLLVAANTGISAWIDPHGQIRERGAKRKATILYAAVPTNAVGTSFYRRWGDGFAAGCLLLCGMLAVSAVLPVRRRREL